MANRWNERDLLRLTRDCDLGLQGEQLHVVEVDGPYMTARHSGGLLVRTGRDYAYAAKIGEAAVDWRDKPPSGDVAVTSSRATTVSRDGIAKLVRDYFAARDEFDAYNIVKEPTRCRDAAKVLERVEAALREAAGAPP